MLWNENQNEGNERGELLDCDWLNINRYEVYRSDKLDRTYMGDYYNYDDAINPDHSFSLSLLVSCLPVHKEQTIARAKKIAELDEN